MITTLIVPGLDASPHPHWQHWWSESDPHALMVELSNPDRPDPATWELELAATVLRHPDCVLVGHSLGSVLVARVLARWPQLRVRAALLVAPADPDTEAASRSRIAAFAAVPERRLTLPSTVVASRNDPWMQFERATALAGAWGAELVDLGHAGHVNVASGHGPWPQGKRLRDALLARATTRADPDHPALWSRPRSPGVAGRHVRFDLAARGNA